MNQIDLGKSGLKISKMGLGTWAIGGGPAWNGDLDRRQCIDTICTAPKVGINIIDTAPGYNFGNSEKIVGEALKELDRDDIVVETKFGLVWDREGAPFNKVGDVQLYKNLSKESIREEIEKSLDRLGVDHVDIYMSHWQAEEPFKTPIRETMEVLNELKREGKIRAIGAANISVDQIREYLRYGDLDIVQGKYSILDREVEKELIPLCKENNMVLQAYSPLEQGLLSGTLTRDYKPAGAQANKKWFQPGNMERVIDMLEEWKPLCEKYNCTIPVLALAWILNQGDFVTILTGATTPDQLEENVLASEIILDPEDLRWMREKAEALDA